MTLLLIPVAFVVLCLVTLIVSYNRLVRLRNKVNEAWSGIDVQLERRHDLIPNLVAAVQGYATHEQGVFEQVATARAAAQAATGPVAAGEAETALGAAVGNLLAVAESYPQLQASANFLQLQRELTETEDEIGASRRIYNGNVQIYNTRIASLPTVLWAGSLSFGKADLFEAEPEARLAPSAAAVAPGAP
jgi:LemA protein